MYKCIDTEKDNTKIKMVEFSANDQGKRVKRCKLAGSVSYGNAPTKFTGDDEEKMLFNIHNFAELQEKKGEHIITKAIQVCGHPWKLAIFSRGNDGSHTDAEYVSIYLVYAGKNTATDPVVAKAVFQTKTVNYKAGKTKFWKNQYYCGYSNFAKREDIVQKELNQDGTLTIEIEIEVAKEKRSV